MERLRIFGGSISTDIIVNDGEITEEDIPMSHLRVRSRKATVADCTSFLRPGIDICALTTTQNSEDTDGDNIAQPVSP